MTKKKSELKKPEKQTKTFYDYNKCRNYLQEKFGYDERDYGRKYQGKYDENAPYLDFWHWVIDNYSVSNGCFVTFHVEMLEEIEKDWVKEIFQHYMDEFAEDGELEMYVWW